MTFVVPFDGQPRTVAALKRAREFADALGRDVVVVSVVPQRNAAYARERGWLAAGEPFDMKTVVRALREQVRDIAPEAAFEFEQCSRSVTGNRIAKPVRKVAKRHEADMVFVGSDDAGRLTTTASSVGNRIATDGSYDVVLVRSS